MLALPASLAAYAAMGFPEHLDSFLNQTKILDACSAFMPLFWLEIKKRNVKVMGIPELLDTFVN